MVLKDFFQNLIQFFMNCVGLDIFKFHTNNDNNKRHTFNVKVVFSDPLQLI